MKLLMLQSRTSPWDGCLPQGRMARGPGQHPVQQHELASAQATPGYPCPHVASEQPARWMNVPGDTNLLPTAILRPCCCCITARWSGNGWFAPIMGSHMLSASNTRRASSAGSVMEMRSPVTGLGLFAMKKMKPKPQAYFSSVSSGTSRESSLLMNFFPCNSNQNKKNST